MEIRGPLGLETMAPAMRVVENYYAWVFNSICGYMGRRILEIGPGYGNLAKLIGSRERRYAGVDVEATVIQNLKESFKSNPFCRFWTADIVQEDSILSLSRMEFDTVISMNVLEHLEQPVAHLSAMLRIVPRGRLIVLVPALPWIYGSLDEQAGHLRRYNPKLLRQELETAGAIPERIFFFNAVGALGWLVSGRILKQKVEDSSLQKSILFYDQWVIPFARLLDPVLRPFFGQSLIAIARAK